MEKSKIIQELRLRAESISEENERSLELQLLDEMTLKKFEKDDAIAAGALLEIEIHQQKKWYFLANTSSGTMLKIGDDIVLVISVFSSLGNAVVGLKEGNQFEVETEKGKRTYHICSVS